MNQEQWKQIFGYEGFYEVSNLGNVRSVDRYTKHPHGGMMLRKGRAMKQCKNKYGYMNIRLGKEGIEKAHLVHRLIATAFLENKEDKPQVNHKDGNKSNNNLDNLEWSTLSENRLHSYQVLNADCWLRGIKGNLFNITNSIKNKRMVGHFVLPKGWLFGWTVNAKNGATA